MRLSLKALSRTASILVRKRTARRPADDDAVSVLEYARDRDLEENLETAPAADERIDLHCLWAVEFYTPSFADRLLENLAKLGWDQEGFPSRESPASWVRMSRQLPEGGSWLNLGIIRSRADKNAWPPGDRTAELPKNVRYANGGLCSITPSLTCIVMRFVFEDGYERELEAALRENRTTCVRSVVRGHQILGPLAQKAEQVRGIRRERMVMAIDWFRENLPGIFSAGLLEGKMPTCELITLREQEPFPSWEGEGRPPQYLSILELESPFSGWVSTDSKKVKFALEIWPESGLSRRAFIIGVNKRSEG